MTETSLLYRVARRVLLVGGVLLASCSEDPVQAAKVSAFDFAGRKYPILWAGEAISAAGNLQVTGTFAPLFGADRAAVQPAPPVAQNGGRLVFTEPGEYYLYLGEERMPLKVLVLSPDEQFSGAAVRIFDFCVANMLAANGNDGQVGTNKAGFVADWFRSDDPAMVLCGATYAMFEELIRESLRLPVRMVTFPGIYLTRDGAKRTTHNIPEVYLPDLGKWVMFDINNALLVKWLDASEMCVKVREAVGESRGLTPQEWDAMDWDIHAAPDSRRPVSVVVDTPDFHPDMVSERATRRVSFNLSHALVGGPAYKPGAGCGLGDLPRDFDVYFASLHTDPKLTQMAIDWEAEWDLKTKVCTLPELRRMLDDAAAGVLAKKAWATSRPR